MMKTTKNAQALEVSTPAPAAAAAAAVPAPPAPPEPTPATPPPTPDPNAALEAYVEQTVAEIDAIEVGLGADPPLTPGDKRHAGKMRKGGEPIVEQIGNLAQQHNLESQALAVAVMLALVGKARALLPLANRLAAFAKHVDDVRFKALSEALSMALQYYALLKRRALTDAELATAMQPIVQFFAYRHPKTKAAGTPTRRQRRAARKAVETLAKTAPELLKGSEPAATATQAPAAQAPQGGSAVTPAATAGGNGSPAPAGTQTNGHS